MAKLLDKSRHYSQIFGQTENGAIFHQDGIDYRGDGTAILTDAQAAEQAAAEQAAAEQAAAEQAAAEQAAAEQAAAEQAAAEQAAAEQAAVRPKKVKVPAGAAQTADDEDLA